jgi:hypothetical protein
MRRYFLKNIYYKREKNTGPSQKIQKSHYWPIFDTDRRNLLGYAGFFAKTPFVSDENLIYCLPGESDQQ